MVSFFEFCYSLLFEGRNDRIGINQCKITIKQLNDEKQFTHYLLYKIIFFVNALDSVVNKIPRG